MTQVTGYTKLQIRLHWAIAALVLFNFIFGETIGEAFDAILEGGTAPGAGHYLHIGVGFAVAALTLVRIAVRLISGAPAAGPTPGDKGAAALQGVLYLLTLLVPVLGSVAWFTLNESVGDIHALLANVIIGLALLHSLAALFHQFVLKDGLLWRMVRAR